MALTDNCDVFGAVHEDGFNLIFRHLMRQRPSLFNYGTQLFESIPDLLCAEIHIHPDVLRRNNPLITVEDPLPLIGTGGILGVDFCFQVVDLKIDFHPGSQFDLPSELDPPLGSQRLALFARVCGAIACPDPTVSESYADLIAGQTYPATWLTQMVGLVEYTFGTIPPCSVECFCLDLFAVAYAHLIGPPNAKRLAIRLEGLEIVDIQPEGLENSLECYIATTVRVGILPRLRLALDTFDFELGEFANLSISPTPISASVPHNPAIEDDQLKVSIDVEVSP